MLNCENFKEVIRNTNLFAFDLIIKDNEENVLLTKRNNSPAKNIFFVPGGRVFKNENLNDAFARILQDELSLSVSDFDNINMKGLYNHIYNDNIFSDISFGTHYIVCAVELYINTDVEVHLDGQHSNFKFLNTKLLLDDDLVHQYVKNYFLKSVDNIFNIGVEKSSWNNLGN